MTKTHHNTAMSTAPKSQPPTKSEIERAHIRDFKLNHPKNYFAVPVAKRAAGTTDFLIREYAVDVPQYACRGAAEANLITSTGQLTELGEAVVITANCNHGCPRNALEAFGELYRSPKRFVTELPAWRSLAKRVAFQYEPTKHLVHFLREQGRLPLSQLAWLLWKHNPTLAESVFLHPAVTNDTAVTPRTQPQRKAFRDPSLYRSEAVFQYKAFLFHCGILDSRGGDASRLQPTTDTWTLESGFK